MNSVSPLIDMLVYQSYRFNRENNPHIEPQRWESIFPNANIYEELFEQQKQGNQIYDESEQPVISCSEVATRSSL
jgi:hypothetical protein